MINNCTFALIIEEYEYIWEVKTLLTAAKKSSTVNWTIPESFLLEWSWEEEDVATHVERCLEADLSYPILVWDDKILDGSHRAVKALALGQSEVKAKVIRDIPAPDKILDFDSSNYEDNTKHNFKDIVEIVKAKLSL